MPPLSRGDVAQMTRFRHARKALVNPDRRTRACMGRKSRLSRKNRLTNRTDAFGGHGRRAQGGGGFLPRSGPISSTPPPDSPFSGLPRAIAPPRRRPRPFRSERGSSARRACRRRPSRRKRPDWVHPYGGQRAEGGGRRPGARAIAADRQARPAHRLIECARLDCAAPFLYPARPGRGGRVVEGAPLLRA